MTVAPAAFRSNVNASRLLRPPSLTRARSRGQALIVLVFMLSIATMLLVYGSTTELSRAVSAEQRTRAVLEEARQALIGRAVADANRPGSLPCPDSGDDGSADLFVGSACPTYIGRLPWRSLGVGDLRDESGERLWYAISPNFRDHPGAPPVNSDTRGTLTVYSGNDSTPSASDAVAVVFAAGPAVAGQRRDADVHACAGRSVPRARCPANYLDQAGKISNASGAGPFIATAPSTTFNDKLVVITTADFMPLVERRVARELREALLAYRQRSSCACFPWADADGDGSSEAGSSKGRIPVKAALPQSWPAGMLPAYIAANDWPRVFHYAAARTALDEGGASCRTCSDTTLAVDSAGPYDVVLLTPGHATGALQRSTPADYFEDADNHDGDDRFITPSSSRADRDAIYTIAAAGAGCALNARTLIDNAPCGAPGGIVRPACQAAASNMAGCSCAASARALVAPPCASRPAGAECAASIVQLRRCTS